MAVTDVYASVTVQEGKMAETDHVSVIPEALRKQRAAGISLLLILLDWSGYRDQNLFHRNIEKCTKGVEIINRWQGFSTLLFVDCTWLGKTEPSLQIFYGKSTLFAQTGNVMTCRDWIDDRKYVISHVDTSFWIFQDNRL